MLALTTPVSAQWVTVDSTFPSGSGPNAWVRTLAVQADAKVLIGGGFTNVSGSSHQYIARVGTNGVIDEGFVTQVSSEPTRIQPLLDGRILISGSFSNVNSVACPGLARLQPDGGLDVGFGPPSGLSAAGSVAGLAASNGSVWVTGTFTNLGGLPRNRVARLLSDGAVDPSFQSPFGTTDTVALVALQLDGKPLLSGTFSNLAGISVTNLVRLNIDGSVDASFQPGLAPGERVIRGLLMPDGRLVAAVAGYADVGLAITPPRLVRFNPDGSVDPAFNVSFESPGMPYYSTIYALALQPDGKILVSGTFLRVNGVSRGKLARLGPDGALDFCFDMAMGGEWTPLAAAPMRDGSVVVGGSFSGLQGQSHPYLLRLLPPAGCAPGVVEMAVPALEFREDALRAVIPVVRYGGADLEQSVAFTTRDGSAQAGSDYGATSGTLRFARGERSQFITVPLYRDNVTEGPDTFEVQLTQANDGATLGGRTNAVVTLTDAPAGTAGAPDTNFVVQLDGPVQAILPLPDGRAVLAGTFTNVNGQFSPNLARLRADGTLETAFLHSQPLDGQALSLAMDDEGRLLVAGDLQHVDGLWRPGLARFGTDGALDNTFAPFDAVVTNYYGSVTVQAVTVLEDSGIVCSATLPGAGYDSYDVLLKLSAAGVVDSAFTNRMPPEAVAVRLQPAPDGDFFLLGAGFGSMLTRLHPDGTLNLDFIPPADRQSTYYVGDMNLLPDGRVMVGGMASAYYGLLSAGPLWRLNPDGSVDAGFSISNSAASLGTLDYAEAFSSAPDGRVLVAGTFYTDSSDISTLRRLLPDGSPDWSFDPGSGLIASPSSGSATVNALAALPGGGWLAGGDFAGYNGLNQRYLVKLLPETLLQPLAFAFTVTNVSLVESNTVLTFEVRRSGDASVPASVTVFTQDGRATAGADYLALNTDLTFAAGEWSKTVSVTILDDAVVEATEQFTLCLTNATGGFTLGQHSTVTISIQNNDAGVEFTQDEFPAVEEDGFAQVSIRWSGTLSTDLQAQVRIVPVTGSSGDLGVTNLTVRYGMGYPNSTNLLWIPVLDDAQHEPTRQFRLELSGSAKLTVGPRSNALLVLDDRDFVTTPARGVAGVIEAIANAPAGGVYLAGDFSSVHGVPRSRVARLLPDGEVDTSFAPGDGPDADVTAIAVQADGKVLIAGTFAKVAGTPRAGLARLNPDGSIDSSFDPGLGIRSTNATAFVRVLLPRSDGRVWVGGAFNQFNNRPGRHVARLLSNGSVDTTFTSPFSTTSSFPGPPILIDTTAIYSLVEQPDGKLVAGGVLYAAALNGPSSVVRLSQTGPIDSSFTTSRISGDVYSVALTPDGKILVGGTYTISFGGTYTTNWLAVWRLGTNGSTDAAFRVRNAPSAHASSSEVRQLLVQPDGRIVFSVAIFVPGSGGPLKPVGNAAHVIVGRLLADGSLDNSFAPLTCSLPLLQQFGPFWFNSPTIVRSQGPERIVPGAALARQPDGVFVLAGAFDSINGEPRRRLARVDPDGSLRGRLLLELMAGKPMRLSSPGEVEFPYVLETSSDLTHWTEWLGVDYPWWPVELSLAPNEPARFLRARPAP